MTWEAPRCDLDGMTGEVRVIGAYLGGPSGKVLLDYLKEAEKTHRNTLKQLYQGLAKANSSRAPVSPRNRIRSK